MIDMTTITLDRVILYLVLPLQACFWLENCFLKLWSHTMISLKALQMH